MTRDIVIDNESGLIIVHPDVLISPTRIVESCACIRRSVLSDRVRSFGGYSYAASLGNLKHMFIEVRNSIGTLCQGFINVNVN